MSSVEGSYVWKMTDLLLPIVQTLNRCTQFLLEKSKDPVLDDEIAREQSRLEDELVLEEWSIFRFYNHYIVVLGMQFSTGDVEAVKKLSEVEAALPQFLTQDEAEIMNELRDLQSDSSDAERLDFMRRLVKQAETIKNALAELAMRQSLSIPLPKAEPTYHSHLAVRDHVRSLFLSSRSKATFCEGALHLQKHTTASLSTIASPEPDCAEGSGYVCNHCGLSLICLELSENGPIRFDVAEWKTLATCHMHAHFYFPNFAAWYMCTVCHDRGIPQSNNIFVTPIMMIQHLKEHQNEKIEWSQVLPR